MKKAKAKIKAMWNEHKKDIMIGGVFITGVMMYTELIYVKGYLTCLNDVHTAIEEQCAN